MSDYKTRAALSSDLQHVETFQRRLALKVDGATPLEDIMKPAFWVNSANKLEQFATIVVMPSNGSYYAELLVTKVLTTSTGVKIPSFTVLLHKPLNEVAAPAIDTRPADKEPAYSSAHYRVEWKGREHKHVIIRTEDKALIEKNISTKADAIKRVEELEAA